MGGKTERHNQQYLTSALSSMHGTVRELAKVIEKVHRRNQLLESSMINDE